MYNRNYTCVNIVSVYFEKFLSHTGNKEIIMNPKLLIVSVESRKGGVGKTTAALNLARILLEKENYNVLFLDVDITGTNVIDGLDSPFWKDICHKVSYTANNKSEEANLLTLFAKQFMAGLGVPVLKVNAGNDTQPVLTIDLRKINTIGSQIYNINGSNNSSPCICSPSILFDELHAFWFIEFLQEICQLFITLSNDKPVAIIIDNSPGYVGIAPAVQEWLTDLGPDIGKFLTVSSLDKQDLVACEKSIQSIHELYVTKWSASRNYHRLKEFNNNIQQEINLEKNQEQFLLRLIEATSINKISKNNSILNTPFEFYFNSNNKKEKYSNSPNMYQGIVINRVPPIIKKRKKYTDINELFYQSRHISQFLFKSNKEYMDVMVPYDEYIEFQFLRPDVFRESKPHSRKMMRIEKEFMRFSVPEDSPIRKILYNPDLFDRNMFTSAKEYLRIIQEETRSIFDQYVPFYFKRYIHFLITS